MPFLEASSKLIVSAFLRLAGFDDEFAHGRFAGLLLGGLLDFAGLLLSGLCLNNFVGLLLDVRETFVGLLLDTKTWVLVGLLLDCGEFFWATLAGLFTVFASKAYPHLLEQLRLT